MTINTTIKILFLFALIVLSLGFVTHKAQAITVSPIRLEYAIDPGGSSSGSIKVLNDQEDVKDLYVSVAKFESKDDESGEPRFVPGNDGVASWIKQPEKISAKANEFTEVPFTISIPAGTEPGGYFAAIFVTSTPPSAPGVISLATDVGTLLFIRVNGNFPEGENLSDFTTKDGKNIFTSLPVEFSYRMTNVGADRIKPVGEITIKNIFGLSAKILNANTTEGSVLPGSKRKFAAAWVTSGGGVEQELNVPKDLPKTFFQNVVWQWKHFAVGRYSAKLGVVINHDSSRSYNKTINFYVFPWQLLSVIFGSLLIILTIATIAAILIILMIIRRKQLRE